VAASNQHRRYAVGIERVHCFHRRLSEFKNQIGFGGPRQRTEYIAVKKTMELGKIMMKIGIGLTWAFSPQNAIELYNLSSKFSPRSGRLIQPNGEALGQEREIIHLAG
jgi:hypothetical protein